jgi:Mg-chelatase subunit ChlD
MNARLACLLACVGATAACGSSNDGSSGLSSTEGSGNVDGSVVAFDAGPSSTPITPIAPITPISTIGTTGAGSEKCLVQPVDVKGHPPDMLILLDASLSMAATRWGPSVDAVKKITNLYQATVDFGLAVFPPGGLPSCGDPNLDVPPGPNNAQAIANALPPVPAGLTPTGQALTAALKFLGPRMAGGPDMAASKPAYVLLFTDGQPDCPGPDTVEAAKALYDAGIPVFVIGYGIDGLGDGMMNQIAQAGGTDHYYKVEDSAGGAGLDAALTEITKDVVRCDFDLATDSNPDPKLIYITIDGKEVLLSDTDGAVVSGRHITLKGTACSSLKDGAAHAVKAEVRCEPIR